MFVNKDNMQGFAKAKITEVKEKTLGEVTDEDFDDGHEKYPDRETILAHYKQYYGDEVTFDSIIKMVAFELVEGLSLHINS